MSLIQGCNGASVQKVSFGGCLEGVFWRRPVGVFWRVSGRHLLGVPRRCLFGGIWKGQAFAHSQRNGK